MPFEKAWANTTTSGSTTNTVRKVTASAMMTKRDWPRLGAQVFRRRRRSRRRTRFPRSKRGAAEACRCRPTPVAAVTKPDGVDIIGPQCAGISGLRPTLQAIDREDDQERRHQHDDGNRRRIGVAELGKPDHDQQRRDFRTFGRLPAIKMTEPYSPTARANANANPVSSAGIRSSAGSPGTPCASGSPPGSRPPPRFRRRDRSAPAVPCAPQSRCR